jgi:hypothetical protein
MHEERRDKERFEREMKERARLLALTEQEAIAEGVPIWYQRMRYLREIEAAEWLKKVRANLVEAQPVVTYGRAGRHKNIWKGKEYD